MLWNNLFEDLAEYLHMSAEDVRLGLTVSHQAVVDAWLSLNPQTAQDRQQFYVDTDTYLLELAAWILDFPARQNMNEEVYYFAQQLKLATALDFGCGIGNEAVQLAILGTEVSVCEVSDATFNFAAWRAKKYGVSLTRIKPDALTEYDLAVLIDVVGHHEESVALIVELAKHCKYLYYTEDFKLIDFNPWPMHLEKPPNFDRAFRGAWRSLYGNFYESKLRVPHFRIDPRPEQFGSAEGGVRRHVEGLTQLLPQHGIVIDTDNPDFVHTHALATHPRQLIYTSHGFYPWNTPKPNEIKMNTVMKRNVASAKRVISVSKEAAEIFLSHLQTPASVVKNGVFLGQLDRVERGVFKKRFGITEPFFLWAKNTTAGVCDPTPALNLARALPQYTFVFTLAPNSAPPNVHIIGTMPHAQMLEVLADCAVYLGTTKEQFAVQTLEAMGLSKPVLCLSEGGNATVVSHLESGFIANDAHELMKGAELCLANSAIWGTHARQKIAQTYAWEHIATQVVEVYSHALTDYAADLIRPLVSVIIPHYNLHAFLPEAIDSVLAQTLKDVELIVIDDGSPVGIDSIIKQYSEQPVKFITQKNQGVAAARNAGIQQSHGKYICCLDADDAIKPTFLEELTAVLETDWQIGLAYSDFELFGDATGIIPCREYDFDVLREGNFIPCCNVFRRTAWERTGGYRDINPSWEDYELWLHMGKLGFVGKRVPKSLFRYRKRAGHGRDFQSQGHETRLRAIVNAYHPDLYQPSVSIIIPTYNHTHLIPDTLQSIQRQTWRDFEVIVVDDGNKDGRELEKLVQTFSPSFPIRLIRHEQNRGLAHARNTGVSNARGKYILTLDSDDLIKPTFLERTVEVLELRPDIAIVYTDIETFGAVNKVMEMPDYDYDELLRKNLMACASLYRREVFSALNGYMTDMTYGWEDYDFWIRAGRIGYCGLRIPEPLFQYRRGGETMIMKAQAHVNEMRRQLKEHSPDVFRGEKPVGCCGRTRSYTRVESNVTKQGFVGNAPGAESGEYPLVMLDYLSSRPLMIRGRITGTFYRVTGPQTIWADPRDASFLLSRGDFRYAEQGVLSTS